MALLKGSAVTTDAMGEEVSIRPMATGDLIAVHATLGPLGRLAGIDTRLRQCLATEGYVGVVAEGSGNGPEVLLSRIA